VRAAAHLSDGAEVDVQDGETTARARVRTVIPVGDAVTRTVEVRVENPDNRWLIGQAVRVAVPSDRPRRVVAVPRDALVLRAENIYVFKVNGRQVAERVAVSTGIGRGPLVEISGPVADGDTVVVRGAETLRDGQKVEVLTTS
jgi:membrane fusion protein, multidrug efflux system